jgi:hypothetical protein
LLSSRACFRLPVRNEINLQSGNKKVLTFTQQKNCPAKLDHLTQLSKRNKTSSLALGYQWTMLNGQKFSGQMENVLIIMTVNLQTRTIIP